MRTRKGVRARYLSTLGALVALTATLVPSGTGIAASVAFPQGVAARATATTAMLWTRTEGPGEFTYEVSITPDFTAPALSGPIESLPSRDLTARVTVTSLAPQTTYYYRFRTGEGDVSDVGTFRTLPAAATPAAMELALTGDSDSLWNQDPTPQAQPFEVLERIAEETPDMFIYMGDTIYSDSETGAPLARTRAEKWAKYRANRDLVATQDVLKSVSTWAVWDDHEVVNDFDGAVLSGKDPALLKAGKQAFNDYWPAATKKYYRKVDFGSNIDLFFLDERSYRTKSVDETKKCRDSDGDLDFAPSMPQDDRDILGLGPVPPKCLKALNDQAASMLGEKQLAWLKNGLKSSTATWKLIVNEVPITQLFVLPYDRWDGYLWERNHLLSFIQKNVSNVVFLTTDIHANYGARIYKDITKEGATPAAYEVVAGPIQTCTLHCEIERIGGAGSGNLFKNFLINQGLVDADCIEINRYGYSMLRSDDGGQTLTATWQGNEPADSGVGGKPLCNPVTLP